MIVFYLILFVLLIIPLPEIKSANKGGGYHEDYLKPNQTLPIKGIFVILVFFRHSVNYLNYSESILDKAFLKIDSLSSQLIVSAFLFYSGFGIYESIKTKGSKYIKDLPRKRLFKTWSHFAVCVLLFILYDIVANKIYPIKTILLSFVGWESIGNSNWYMFVTFSLYILLYIAFRAFSDVSTTTPFVIFNLVCIVFIIVLYFVTTGEWWYNTIPCFMIGMWYSRYKIVIEKIVQKSGFSYNCTLFIIFSLFSTLYLLYYKGITILFLIVSPLFSVFLILLTMKIKIRSIVLSYLGKHLFTIYMLQRLSFLMLAGTTDNCYVNFLISFFTTIIMAVVLDEIFLRTSGKVRKV